MKPSSRFWVGGILWALCAPLLMLRAEATLQKGDRLFFLGDSITVASTSPTGFVTILDETLDQREPDNTYSFHTVAKGGRGVRFLKSSFPSKVEAANPQVVVIYIGINDVRLVERNPNDNPEQYRSMLTQLVESAQALPAQVVICSPAIRGEKTDGSNPYDALIDQYANICREVAIETQASFINLRSEFMATLKRINPQNDTEGHLTKDGVHPNAAGNKLIANALLTLWGYDPIP
ncbi:GDSL-type esterase/lipase family protein [Kiritimatiellota bacterium B12222]|nr:GDSL-type esterase/lipase family protein [Kiritimatiellota bacterium B12222]